MTPQEILDAALEVHDNRKKYTQDELKTMHPVFSESYSHLFDMCLTDNLDKSILKQAIYFLQCRQDNKLDDHDSDVEFGKVLAAKYLPKK